MIKQECIGIPDMILLLMIFCFKKIKIKAEIVLSPGGAYFSFYSRIKTVIAVTKVVNTFSFIVSTIADNTETGRRIFSAKFVNRVSPEKDSDILFGS